MVLFITGVVIAFRGDSEKSDNGSDTPIDQSSTGVGPEPPNDVYPAAELRPQSSTPWLDDRLSTDIIPTHYTLTLSFDLDNLVYAGSIISLIDVLNDVNYIIMHSTDQSIDSVKVDNVDAKFRLNTTSQYLIIELDQSISYESNIPVYVSFSGTMKTDSNPETGGFLLSMYNDLQRLEHRVMSSLFQPAFTRAAFPCFDEPEFKATWDITVNSAAKYPTVLSNMPYLEQTEQSDQSFRTVFETTPAISPHHVSIHVSDYQYRSASANCSDQTIDIKVWAPVFALDGAAVPALIAARQAEYFCSYFNSMYPVTKEDHVVIPEFPVAGLESLGLISYSTKMLYDSKQNTVQDLLYTVGVISHEQAHQYFGDLMTAGWWTDLAFTESFASYLEYAAGNASNSDLMISAQFLLQAADVALSVDSSAESRPLITSIKSTNSYPLSQNVAQFPYQKAGAMIRMIQAVIGEDVFRAGVLTFLNDHMYKIGYSGDIFDYLTKAYQSVGGSLDVADFMKEWMLQQGYPLLTCTSYEQGEADEWKCTQQRFFSYSGHPVDNTKWEIFITSLNPSASISPQFPLWFHRSADSITFSVRRNSMMKLNVDETGFFRVLYDTNNWRRLGAGLMSPGHAELEVDDRINIFDDAWVFAQQDMLTYPIWGDLTRYLNTEMDPVVWMKVSPQLLFIYSRLPLGTARLSMTSYLRNQMDSISRAVDVSSMSSANITRAYLMEAVGVPLARMDYERAADGICYGDGICSRLDELYQEMLKGRPLDQIDSSVVQIMFEVAINRYGLDEAFTRYRKALSSVIPGFPQQADRIRDWTIQAMGSTLERSRFTTVISWLLDGSKIDRDDALSLFQSLCSHPLNRDRLIRILTDRFSEFLNHFAANPERFGLALEYLLNRIHKQADLDTAKGWLIGRSLPDSITSAFARGEKQARENIAWSDKYLKVIENWIQTI